MTDSLIDLQSLVEWNRSVLNPPITPGLEAMVLDHFNRYAARLRDTTPTAAPAGEAVAWMHGVCADDGEEDQALSFSPDNFPLEGVAGYRKVWCRPLIYGDTHPPAAEVREVNRGR